MAFYRAGTRHEQCVCLFWGKSQSTYSRRVGHRPNAISSGLILAIMTAVKRVIDTQGTRWTMPLVHPVALGILIAAGIAIRPPTTGTEATTTFSASTSWLFRLVRQAGWKFVKPVGDARKAPANAVALGHDFMLRLSYLVNMHKIPPALVINADQTGEVSSLPSGWTKTLIDD